MYNCLRFHISKILFFHLLMLAFSCNSFANNLTMNLSGYINNRCEINFNSGNSIDLSKKKMEELPFKMHCNQPLMITLASKNGGLKKTDSNSYYLVPYSLEIWINSVNIGHTLKSQDLLSQASINSSGAIPFTTSGNLRVTLEKYLLYAGHYEDVIEIDVFPSINSVFN